MPTVTELQPQARDPERINLYLDGRFALGLSLEVVQRHGIHVGDALEEAELRALHAAEAEYRAYAVALNLLSFRPRARREVELHLRKRGEDDATIETVIQRLTRAGLLDDREFARFWLENRQAFRRRGTLALRAEMRGKGVDPEIIDEILASLPDEAEAAYEAGAARLRALATLEDREFYRKLLAFLLRRGFPYPASIAAVRRHLGERGGSPDIVDQLGPEE